MSPPPTSRTTPEGAVHNPLGTTPKDSLQNKNLYLDRLTVVRLRREARDRRALQQRSDGRAAFLRIPERNGPDETRIAREAGVLYQMASALEDAGKVKWDTHEGTWVEKRTPIPVYRRNGNNRPIYTSDQVLEYFEKVRKTSNGWSARCPAHEDKSPSLTVAEGTKGWLFKCWAGCDFNDILKAAGLDVRQVFV